MAHQSRQNRLYNLLLFAIAITFWATPTTAQSNSGCYMVDSNGNTLDLSSLCGGASRPRLPTGVYQIPIKRRMSGIPVIDVTFNNNQTFEMLLDTGASGTVLTPRMANSLNLKPEGIAIMNTPSDTGVRVPVSRVNSISVGGAIARDLPVIVSPALELGLLGQNFFGNYDVSIKESLVEFRVR
jgi:predicted aspartyl protease